MKNKLFLFLLLIGTTMFSQNVCVDNNRVYDNSRDVIDILNTKFCVDISSKKIRVFDVLLKLIEWKEKNGVYYFVGENKKGGVLIFGVDRSDQVFVKSEDGEVDLKLYSVDGRRF